MSNEIQKYLDIIAQGKHLDIPDAGRVFQIIMSGGATSAQMAAALIGLRINGETVEEISGAAMALRNKVKKVEVPDKIRSKLMDTCGTGGDKKGTYNISTAVAIVTAACGVPVAKHGNKAISSRSGSADVLRALGVNIDIDENGAAYCLQEAGICFMMAPRFHTAMRHVAPVRQELAMRTIFNLLGPLVNPAMPERQLIGVYDRELIEKLANVLHNLGSSHAWVVHGADGMDEITIMDETYVAELREGKVSTFTIKPEELGIERPEDEDALIGGDEIENANALRSVLKGEQGPYRDIVLINTAAALLITQRVSQIKDGMQMAATAIDNKLALQSLEKLVEVSNSLGVLSV